MATKKRLSGKPLSDAVAEKAEVLTGLPGGGLIIIDEDEKGEAFGVPAIHVEPDFATLESRVAQAEQGYASAVASVGTTADELREARAALREARGG